MTTVEKKTTTIYSATYTPSGGSKVRTAAQRKDYTSASETDEDRIQLTITGKHGLIINYFDQFGFSSCIKPLNNVRKTAQIFNFKIYNVLITKKVGTLTINKSLCQFPWDIKNLLSFKNAGMTTVMVSAETGMCQRG